jgi:CelD/BcsL family acetyltransferase involved in cellulose biosynthesis
VIAQLAIGHELDQMRTELIADWPGFFSLAAEWDDLLADSRADTIFLTWDWIRTWVEVAGHRFQPLVITVRDAQGVLVGAVPFYLTELRLLRSVPFRTLRIMADYATGAEYPDWIVRRGCEEAAVDAIAAALASSPDWDCIWMPAVSGWTGAAERLLRACDNHRFYCHKRSTDFAYFDLPPSWDAYLHSLSQNRRQQMRADMKRVMQRPGVTVSRCETADQLPAFLDALFELHHLRWKAVGEVGTFHRKPREAEFYRSFAQRALQNGWLRVFGLQENGAFKAVQIGYAYRGIFLQLQEGFDPAYVRGVGNVLRAKTIEAFIEEGLKGYDFLGAMTEHKRRWLAQQRDGWDFFIGRKSLKNAALFYQEIWPTGRYLRPAAGGHAEGASNGCGDRRAQTELITDWSAFQALQSEWDDLLAASSADTVFLTWEWIRSWMEVAGHKLQPFVITARDRQGVLVGVAPFYLTEFRLLQTVPFHTLRVLADYATGAEYPDCIIRRDCEDAAVDAIGAALAAVADRWDCIWMPAVSGWTGVRERVLRICQQQGFYFHDRPADFAYFDLPGSWDAYLNALSPKTRHQVRTEAKKVASHGSLKISRCETADQVPVFLDALFDLHYRRWKALGEEGTFRRKPNEAEFYRRFAPRALQNGWLRIFGLQDNDNFKAVQIGYVYRKVFYSLQEGFDPDAFKGVGNALRAAVIQSCIAEGLTGYDFLGAMTEHKRRWLAQQRDGWDILVGCRSLKNAALFYKEVWPTGRYLRPARRLEP